MQVGDLLSEFPSTEELQNQVGSHLAIMDEEKERELATLREKIRRLQRDVESKQEKSLRFPPY